VVEQGDQEDARRRPTGVAHQPVTAAIDIRRNGGNPVSFAWDRNGNLTADAETGEAASVVAYGYDLADRTTSITPSGGATTVLGLDALGRTATRTTGGPVDTYTYLAETTTVLRVANSGGTITDSLVDAAGTRLGTKTGGTVAWLVPDLHGSIAAGLAGAGTGVTDALRYDGYGVTLATWPAGGSGATSHWKYQGRLDVAPAGAPALYDFGFREYAPGLGAFTSLDDLVGSAQDPYQLNRFAYAAANPATLVDPDGHDSCIGSECDNPTYDNGWEGNDYCVWDCGASATETGPGDAGYTAYRPPTTTRPAPVTTGPANTTPIPTPVAPAAGPGPTPAYWYSYASPYPHAYQYGWETPRLSTTVGSASVDMWTSYDVILRRAAGGHAEPELSVTGGGFEASFVGMWVTVATDRPSAITVDLPGQSPVAGGTTRWSVGSDPRRAGAVDFQRQLTMAGGLGQRGSATAVQYDVRVVVHTSIEVRRPRPPAARPYSASVAWLVSSPVYESDANPVSIAGGAGRSPAVLGVNGVRVTYPAFRPVFEIFSPFVGSPGTPIFVP
jgi:RHS repeat-associated protein